ncbi:ABC transporter permease [Nonomuraea aridisoli]|uniref:ABC transporter permease n=1 Tax=Nonomuraea aridisoli TaxID=2070368 RepID=A0A2W2EXH7_9ACTN|nr:ABC transporter permease [Nonomuraea aridisoli]PZG14107.1 ABC transporter permease [Nonomuraea aridisoli]
MNALPRAAAAEWLKLRSVRSTWWCAGGAVTTMMLVAALEADSTGRYLRQQDAGPGSAEAVTTTVAGAEWVLYIFAALGMLAVTGEYATRTIVVTLACTPSRSRLLLAKAAVVGAASFAAGLLVAALGVAVSAPMLHDLWDFETGRVAGRILAIAARLALVALLALGLGTLIRRSAGTITVVFGLVMVLPLLLQGLAAWSGAAFLTAVAGYTPGPAGQRLVAGDPVAGLVLAAWAAAALAAATWALRARDA